MYRVSKKLNMDLYTYICIYALPPSNLDRNIGIAYYLLPPHYILCRYIQC